MTVINWKLSDTGTDLERIKYHLNVTTYSYKCLKSTGSNAAHGNADESGGKEVKHSHRRDTVRYKSSSALCERSLMLKYAFPLYSPKHLTQAIYSCENIGSQRYFSKVWKPQLQNVFKQEPKNHFRAINKKEVSKLPAPSPQSTTYVYLKHASFLTLWIFTRHCQCTS